MKKVYQDLYLEEKIFALQTFLDIESCKPIYGGTQPFIKKN
jgi:hypothetical protein